MKAQLGLSAGPGSHGKSPFMRRDRRRACRPGNIPPGVARSGRHRDDCPRVPLAPGAERSSLLVRNCARRCLCAFRSDPAAFSGLPKGRSSAPGAERLCPSGTVNGILKADAGPDPVPKAMFPVENRVPACRTRRKPSDRLIRRREFQEFDWGATDCIVTSEASVLPVAGARALSLFPGKTRKKVKPQYSICIRLNRR